MAAWKETVLVAVVCLAFIPESHSAPTVNTTTARPFSSRRKEAGQSSTPGPKRRNDMLFMYGGWKPVQPTSPFFYGPFSRPRFHYRDIGLLAASTFNYASPSFYRPSFPIGPPMKNIYSYYPPPVLFPRYASNNHQRPVYLETPKNPYTPPQENGFRNSLRGNRLTSNNGYGNMPTIKGAEYLEISIVPLEESMMGGGSYGGDAGKSIGHIEGHKMMLTEVPLFPPEEESPKDYSSAPLSSPQGNYGQELVLSAFPLFAHEEGKINIGGHSGSYDAASQNDGMTFSRIPFPAQDGVAQYSSIDNSYDTSSYEVAGKGSSEYLDSKEQNFFSNHPQKVSFSEHSLFSEGSKPASEMAKKHHQNLMPVKFDESILKPDSVIDEIIEVKNIALEIDEKLGRAKLINKEPTDKLSGTPSGKYIEISMENLQQVLKEIQTSIPAAIERKSYNPSSTNARATFSSVPFKTDIRKIDNLSTSGSKVKPDMVYPGPKPGQTVLEALRTINAMAVKHIPIKESAQVKIVELPFEKRSETTKITSYLSKKNGNNPKLSTKINSTFKPRITTTTHVNIQTKTINQKS